MCNTLIVQFIPTAAGPSYDRLIELEEVLIQAFSQNNAAVVDGHDFGTDANIFIFPKSSWAHAIEIVKAHLRHHDALDEVLIIKRLKSGRYTAVWPENYTGDIIEV